jgi:hypothetical protein
MKKVRSPHPYKPQIRSALDIRNRLTDRATVWPFWDATRSIGDYSLDIEIFGSPTFGSFLGGSGYKVPTSGDFIRLGTNGLFNATSFSQLAIFRFESFSAIGATISQTQFSGFLSSVGSGEFRVDSTNGQLQFIKDNTSLISQGTSARVVVAGRVAVAAMSWDGTTCKMALDGIDVSGSSTPPASAILQGRVGLLSKRGTTETTARPAEMHLYGWWTYAMNSSQLVELTRNPTQLFAPRRSIWVPHTASSSGATSRPSVFVCT